MWEGLVIILLFIPILVIIVKIASDFSRQCLEFIIIAIFLR